MQMHTVKAGKTEFTILFTEFSDADGCIGYLPDHKRCPRCANTVVFLFLFLKWINKVKSTLNADISIQGISYSVHAVSFIAKDYVSQHSKHEIRLRTAKDGTQLPTKIQFITFLNASFGCTFISCFTIRNKVICAGNSVKQMQYITLTI